MTDRVFVTEFADERGAAGDASITVRRDDLNVWEDSPSALVVTAEGKTGGALDDGAAVVEGDVTVRIDIGYRRERAVALRDEISRLLDEWPA